MKIRYKFLVREVIPGDSSEGITTSIWVVIYIEERKVNQSSIGV